MLITVWRNPSIYLISVFRVLTIDNSDLGLVAEGAWSGILNVSQENLLISFQSFVYKIFILNFFKRDFLSPGHDWVVTIKSRNFFSIAKVWCCLGFYFYLAAHSSIHASFILRRGLTRFQLPKGFLGLRIIELRNSSDKLEWGPGAILIGNITLIAPKNL